VVFIQPSSKIPAQYARRQIGKCWRAEHLLPIVSPTPV
jgi:hypothetical protein